MNYPLALTRDENGTFLVTCPLLPEVTTFGDTWDDAIRYGGEAVAEALAARASRGEDIPLPDDGEG
jgi:antitoxin HicB